MTIQIGHLDVFFDRKLIKIQDCSSIVTCILMILISEILPNNYPSLSTSLYARSALLVESLLSFRHFQSTSFNAPYFVRNLSLEVIPDSGTIFETCTPYSSRLQLSMLLVSHILRATKHSERLEPSPLQSIMPTPLFQQILLRQYFGRLEAVVDSDSGNAPCT